MQTEIHSSFALNASKYRIKAVLAITATLYMYLTHCVKTNNFLMISSVPVLVSKSFLFVDSLLLLAQLY